MLNNKWHEIVIFSKFRLYGVIFKSWCNYTTKIERGRVGKKNAPTGTSSARGGVK